MKKSISPLFKKQKRVRRKQNNNQIAANGRTINFEC